MRGLLLVRQRQRESTLEAGRPRAADARAVDPLQSHTLSAPLRPVLTDPVAQCRPATAGVVQRVFTSEPENWKGLLLKQARSAEKLKEIDQSKKVNLDIVEQEEFGGGATGLTVATIAYGKDQRVHIRSQQELQRVPKDALAKISSMNIVVLIAKQIGRYSGEKKLVPRDESSTIVGLMHELERHAIPFYDLFCDAQVKAFTDSLKEGTPGIDKLYSQVVDPKGDYAVLSQHEDPDLNANTLVSVLNALAKVGKENVKFRTLFRVAMDTTKRGAGLVSTVEKVPKEYKTTEDFRKYYRLAALLAPARPIPPKKVPKAGTKVIIIEGGSMGITGKVSKQPVIEEYADPEDEVMIERDTHGAVAMPLSWCMTLG